MAKTKPSLPNNINLTGLQPWLYLALPLLGVFLFFYWPLGQAIESSLLDYSHDLYAPEFVGLANYQALFTNGTFWDSLLHTLIFWLGVLPALLILPIPMALLLNQPLTGVTVFRLLIYTPVLLSMVVVGLTWKWLLAYDGLFNSWLTALGLPKLPWLTHPVLALVAIGIVVVWKGLAYYMMLYLTQLQTLNKDLYEAAALDGAEGWKKHWYITLPHLRPTLLLALVLCSIGSFKLFTEVYVMTRGGPIQATETLVYFVYKKAFEELDLGLACAAGLVLALLLLGFAWLQLKCFDEQEGQSVL